MHELLVKPKVGEARGRLGWDGPGHLEERRGGRVAVRKVKTIQMRCEDHCVFVCAFVNAVTK